MIRQAALFSLLLLPGLVTAQEKLSPEMLWSMGRVSADGVSSSGKTLFYKVRHTDWKTEKSETKSYQIALPGGQPTEISYSEGYDLIQRQGSSRYARKDDKIYRSNDQGDTWTLLFEGIEGAGDIRISPDGNMVAFVKEVLVKPMNGTDIYADLPKTTAKVYRDLNDRHWDEWEDGKYNHIFVAPLRKGGEPKDIMAGEPYDSPQKPFGGSEDFMWTPDGKGVVYVCKKKFGKEYALSTNTDLYHYNLATGETTNWTAGMMGYDTNPSFSPDGRKFAFLSMRRDGYESDKTDIIVMDLQDRGMMKMNLTTGWDGAVSSFVWGRNSDRIFFNAAWRGTEQLFEVKTPVNFKVKMLPVVRKITQGDFDIAGIAGQAENGEVIVSRTDFNTAAELWAVDPASGSMRSLTHVNDAIYNRILPSESKLMMVKTTDNKQMGVWVIYPPNFDPGKKYPTLLYCQGGPQSALTQFYSFRWNFALMAAQGYIVVAPNRRGMPGWGVAWNEAISGDWGGQPMKDYLSAIDAVADEPYVDKSRLGCVGASYGGYSVFMLAGMHGKRFKSFIAHDGVFDMRSMYGTTEELWFMNWDAKGPYWQKPTLKTYEQFNPSNFVDKWNTPIMIVQGGIDFRVPIEQGLQAFQAAQLRGIQSKLLYLPNENHWVLHAQNALAWQREFFGWLGETLK